MKNIQTVLQSMTFQDFVILSEQAERERAANDRLAAMEAAEARRKAAQDAASRRRCLELDRPEYLSAKNAEAKDKRYRRFIETRREVERIKHHDKKAGR